jgi:hypothetical protein
MSSSIARKLDTNGSTRLSWHTRHLMVDLALRSKGDFECVEINNKNIIWKVYESSPNIMVTRKPNGLQEFK